MKVPALVRVQIWFLPQTSSPQEAAETRRGGGVVTQEELSGGVRSHRHRQLGRELRLLLPVRSVVVVEVVVVLT